MASKPPPIATREIVYWLTRDSNQAGELSPVVDVWFRKPIRARLRKDGNVWLPSDAPKQLPGVARDLGYAGPYTIAAVTKWFSVVPDDDLQVIRIEQRETI